VIITAGDTRIVVFVDEGEWVQVEVAYRPNHQQPWERKAIRFTRKEWDAITAFPVAP